jgi:hypothetical protein
MQKRVAVGTISFEYDIDDDDKYEHFDTMTDEQIVKALTEEMVDDIISQSFSDLGPCVEIKFVDIPEV